MNVWELEVVGEGKLVMRRRGLRNTVARAGE
jgi:hypothetical protein